MAEDIAFSCAYRALPLFCRFIYFASNCCSTGTSEPFNAHPTNDSFGLAPESAHRRLISLRELPCSLVTSAFLVPKPQQSLERDAVVQRIAGNDPRRGIDGLAALAVAPPQFVHAAAGRQARMRLDVAVVGAREANAAAGGPLDSEPALVHQAVVMTAEQQQVVDRGLAAVRPVFDVMRIDETTLRTAREAATRVAGPQRPAQRRGNCAGLAADSERIARGILGDPQQAAVASDATDRVGRQSRTAVECRAAVGVGAKRFRGNVHDDLVALRRRQGFWAVAQRGFRERHQRIGAARTGSRARALPR